MSIRVGVRRPDRPLAVIAEAEARVIEHELFRRLGDVTVDLRIDDEPVARWMPIAHAAWPTDVDAVIEPSALWRDDLPPVTTLFARTVDPKAASVRRRMLRHLAILPDLPFALDAPLLDELTSLHVRPTDLWIVAAAASSVDVENPSVRALVGDDSAGQLDRAFDEVVSPFDTDLTETVARLRAERDEARDLAVEHAAEAVRTSVELADRLDGLEAENRVLLERIERAELQRFLDG